MKLWRMLGVAVALFPWGALAQDSSPASNGISQPFGTPSNQWATSLTGKPWGSTAGIDRGPGQTVWAVDRCGVNSCDGSDLAPIVLVDLKTGKPIRGIGAGLFVFPHGLHVDGKGNIWIADSAASKDGTKGVQVIELSPQGKVLMRLGTAGVRGDDATHFQSPSDAVVAPNGDIFVADGHGAISPLVPAPSDARIMKFSKTGKLLQQWGKAGSGPGEFNNPHALALDKEGRLLLADRGNSRIEVYSQDGKLLSEWKQFGRPSGFYVAKDDTLYAIDADSTERSHPGWRKGVWIGNAKTAKVTAFVPDDMAGEGIVAGADGNLYGAVNVAPHGITQYPKR